MPTNEPENEIQESTPRSISALLALGTYQGMTDEEIQIVIDYYVSLAEINTRSDTINAQTTQSIATAVSDAHTLAQTQAAMLQSIIDRATNLQLQGVQHG